MPSTRTPTLAALRGYAIARSLFAPTTLQAAFRRMGYVQADPIRAPSRAQDLILRHRVKDYHDGDLERRYPKLAIEEDALHNYGFLHRDLQALLHPRRIARPSRVERSHPGLLEPVLAFVRARGVAHPRDLDQHHGGKSLTNYWGGSSAAATHALDMLHYRGELRVVRRDAGIRVYAPAVHHALDCPDAGQETERVLRLLERMVALYAPLPRASLRQLASMLRYGAPQLEKHLRHKGLIARALEGGRMRVVRVEDVDWVLPLEERIRGEAPERVRLLAPFDPVVWDRRRFELLWKWRYRFEAYTPEPKRKLGYYAMPLLWRDQVIGWGNLRAADDRIEARLGFVDKRPRDAAFGRELDAEVERFSVFMRTSKTPRISFPRR